MEHLEHILFSFLFFDEKIRFLLTNNDNKMTRRKKNNELWQADADESESRS